MFQTDGPIKCFNALKNWSLGLYSSRHATIGSGVGYASEFPQISDLPPSLRSRMHQTPFMCLSIGSLGPTLEQV